MDTDSDSTPTGRTWGRIIRERREMIGMSQYQLADALDVRQGAVSGWERGTRMPTHRNLARLCKTLGLPPSVFVFEDGEAA